MQVFRFRPIYQERIWGGRAFERFGRKCMPGRGNIGESWEICDREDANTRVFGGDFDGFSLRELIRSHGDKIMGPGWHPERRFPILVKWLDSRERLSLQVHPPLAVTQAHGGEPKTETWYIADATSDAALMCGLKKGVTRETFEAALRRNKACEMVHRFPVAKGDSLHLESGRLHAIDAGCLILEIQQNSDTTYRVYDWGRPRELHIEESLRCIDFSDVEPTPLRTQPGERILADCEHYRLRVLEIPEGTGVPIQSGKPAIISLIEGTLHKTDEDIAYFVGDNLLIPSISTGGLVARTASTILITDNFS